MTSSDGASIASKTLPGVIQAIPDDRTAVIAPDQNVRITYRGLRQQIRDLAEALAAPGVSRGERSGSWAMGFYGSAAMALIAAVLAYGLRTSQTTAKGKAAKIPLPA